MVSWASSCLVFYLQFICLLCSALSDPADRAGKDETRWKGKRQHNSTIREEDLFSQALWSVWAEQACRQDRQRQLIQNDRCDRRAIWWRIVALGSGPFSGRFQPREVPAARPSGSVLFSGDSRTRRHLLNTHTQPRSEDIQQKPGHCFS